MRAVRCHHPSWEEPRAGRHSGCMCHVSLCTFCSCGVSLGGSGDLSCTSELVRAVPTWLEVIWGWMGSSVPLVVARHLQIHSVSQGEGIEWWIGPSCGEEDSSWLVFSVAFWAGEDVALVAILGQTKGWSSSGFCPQRGRAQGLGAHPPLWDCQKSSGPSTFPLCIPSFSRPSGFGTSGVLWCLPAQLGPASSQR